MHRDLSLTLALAGGLDQSKPISMQLPRHPDPEVRRDLTRYAPPCKDPSPQPTWLDGDYLCSRTIHHPMPHVAGTSSLVPSYIAEWDDDRSTDNPTGRDDGPPDLE